MTIVNTRTGKKLKVPRLSTHAWTKWKTKESQSGEIVAIFGVDCQSGDSFTDGTINYAMTSMRVPEPVMSYAVAPKSRTDSSNFSKALSRFQREDPKFKVHQDEESAKLLYLVWVNYTSTSTLKE